MAPIRLLVVAAATLFASVSAASAQSAGQQTSDRMSIMDGDRVTNDLTGKPAPVDRRGRKLTAAQVRSAAKSAVQKVGLDCKVTEAALLGVTYENSDLFEVACEAGPGYIFTSPQVSPPLNCGALAENAAKMTADGLTPPPNSACTLKSNQPAG